MGRPTKYNQETRRIIIEARRRGETYEKCAIMAGVDRSQIMAWKARYQDFQSELKDAEAEFEVNRRSILLESAKKGLAELLSGYEYEETKTEYENDKNGNPVIKKQVNTLKKILPNPTAVIFALTNLEPEVWKNRQTTDVNAKTEGSTEVSLANVPDELLAKVIDAINGK